MYAADLFKAMLESKEGLMSAETGAKLRECILRPCASVAGFDMLYNFLGRQPTPDAWCERNGIPN